eukprot:TRINITY_DN65141_c0_g1_i1.p1 TRINITY_DN65141_c0_g1~~TRINITY_DN65141_c0_g1_i1.p1  ORF type:complete len:132 (-),score=8.03 TRINITY_DN65141_c0_g1_i1:19-414(-)
MESIHLISPSIAHHLWLIKVACMTHQLLCKLSTDCANFVVLMTVRVDSIISETPLRALFQVARKFWSVSLINWSHWIPLAESFYNLGCSSLERIYAYQRPSSHQEELPGIFSNEAEGGDAEKARFPVAVRT